MTLRVLTGLGFLLSAAAVVWPAQASAFGRAVGGGFHNAYVSHFFDKATFLVNCL